MSPVCCNMLSVICAGEGPRAHLQKLAECIRWSYGAGIVLRLGNIARLELNYCVPMGVQSGDRYARYYRTKAKTLLRKELYTVDKIYYYYYYYKTSESPTELLVVELLNVGSRF